MNDTSGKTASSLALTEKRPHRPGGCVGIFFQLFDWNRRFAKKKLFSKKLLPPARPKQSSSKFGGDEKLPKLRLIANENSGGFPNVKKNGTSNDGPDEKSGVKPPGLVARLMGLDSMPAVEQDKSKKASSFESGSGKGGCVGSHNRFDSRDSNLEKGSAKGELRPQKLQKTGPSERQPLSRFGAEALQFKSVLSRSRKHRPKLVSPVKSPRNGSGRNACRLIDAATRILEPGLQASNRAKCALTYSSTMHHILRDELHMEETMTQSLDLSKNLNYHVTASRTLQGHSCKNCGSLVGVLDSSPNLVEQPLASSVSNYVSPSFQGLERSTARPAIASLDQEKYSVNGNQEQTLPLSIQARNNIRNRDEAIAKRKPLNREDQIQWQWTTQQDKPQKDVPSSIALKHKTHSQNQFSQSRDTDLAARSSFCSVHSNRVSNAPNAINETKDFVALNRGLNRTRSRMPVKVENCKYGAERKSSNNRHDSLSPERKKRLINVNRQGESSGFVSSTFAKQRNGKRDSMTGMGLNAHSTNRTCNRSIMTRLEDSSRTGGKKDSGVVSFTFSSPMKQKTESGISHNGTRRISISDKTDRMMSSEKSSPLSGDALGALLEQKLKELTCQEEDELAAAGTRPKRTSAMILQELISALTAERPVHDDVAVGSNKEKLIFQAKEQTVGASLGYLGDSDHLSPGCVLEASFSNDSCMSSSVDDSSAPNMHPDSADSSYNGPQPLEPDAELLDSATSLSKGKNGLQLLTNLLRCISEVIYSLGLADSGLKGSKLVHAEEVILNAECFLTNAALQNSNGTNGFSLSLFLVYELETLASALCVDFGRFLLSVEDTKNGNQLKQFLFDCVVEYLDSKYGWYSKSGLRAWSRMPLSMTADRLITGVVGEVRRWARLAGKIPDEIIETEMSHSLGKWTDFEIEACETGVEIDKELLQTLVDEVVMDLCEESLGSSAPYWAAAE